jgi:hypothetical protein
MPQSDTTSYISTTDTGYTAHLLDLVGHLLSGGRVETAVIDPICRGKPLVTGWSPLDSSPLSGIRQVVKDNPCVVWRKAPSYSVRHVVSEKNFYGKFFSLSVQYDPRYPENATIIYADESLNQLESN